jgi:hypothetical protein
MGNFNIDGLEGMQDALNEFVNQFDNEKQKELLKLGYMLESKIKPLVPVDTSRLRTSINTQIINSDNVETGTNVEYAKAVNDGHVMNQHFVSKEMLQANGGKSWQKYNVTTTFESSISGSYFNETMKLPITDPKVKGFTVHPQFVLGKHFMERGFSEFQPSFRPELERWLGSMLDNLKK